jgi:hypothetical protein
MAKMITMESNYCRIVNESLSGERDVDENTLAAVAVLSEKLERLRKIDPDFSDVEFSPYIDSLVSQRRTVTSVV